MKTTLAVVCGFVAAGLLGVASGVRAQSVHRSCKAVFEKQATACIMAPREGSTIQGPSVKVVLDAKNITIAPVQAAKAGAAHYHLLLDANLPSDSTPIPVDLPGVVHLGQGQKQHTFDNLTPGGHRLIVVLGDNTHRPLRRAKADTIHFTVAAR
jgi:hypothetical protein